MYQQPQYYQSYLYPQTTTQTQLQMPQFQQDLQQKASQEHYGFISVNSEQQARNWPIAPGNSLTFKDESSPYIYTKTMGLSQFETPIFEKYRLTKEEDPQAEGKTPLPEEFKNDIQTLKNEFNNIKDSYKSLRDELDEMKNWMRQPFMSKSDNKEA